MKRKTLFALVIAIVMAFAFAVQAFAKSDPVRSVEQDGLKAELEIATDESAPELTNVTLKLTKDSNSKVAGIKATIEYRGVMYRLNEGAMLKTADVAAGTSEELKWVLINREVQTQKTSENESSQGEKQEDGAVKIIIIAAAAVVIVGVLLLIITKSKKGTKAMILVGVMLLSGFALLIFKLITSQRTNPLPRGNPFSLLEIPRLLQELAAGTVPLVSPQFYCDFPRAVTATRSTTFSPLNK